MEQTPPRSRPSRHVPHIHISNTPHKGTTSACRQENGTPETHKLIDPFLADEIHCTFHYDVPNLVERFLLPADETRRRLLQLRVDAVCEELAGKETPPAATADRETPPATTLPPAGKETLFTASTDRDTPSTASPAPTPPPRLQPGPTDGVVWAGCTDYDEKVFVPAFRDLWMGIIDLSRPPPSSAAADDPLPLPAREYYDNRTRYLAGSNAKRKLDFYACAFGGQLRWQDIVLFGEMKNRVQGASLADVNLQMACYAREVFFSQPHRWFVHALYVDRSLVSLYRFDRCGTLVAERFDLHRNWRRFVTAVLAYAYMDDMDMGFDPAYTVIPAASSAGDDDDPTAPLAFANTPPPSNYILRQGAESYHLARVLDCHKSLVGRGTVCWEAKQMANSSGSVKDAMDTMETNLVIKISWRQKSQRPEEEVYRLAVEAGIDGLMDLDPDPSHSGPVVEVVKDIRRGYHGGEPVKRRHSRKRKADATTVDSSSVDTPVSKGLRTQSSTSISGRGPQRSATSEKDNTVDDGGRGEERPENAAGAEEHDRVCTRLVFRNAVGEKLSSITSPRRAFAAVLDAIRVHRQLYLKAGILHRDISTGNILATTPRTKLTGYREHDDTYKPPTGFLIDFDHAITMIERFTGAVNRTGTDAFFAISVLRGGYNSYGADLESFFYVLCWMCCRYSGRPHEPATNHLDEWIRGSEQEKADRKISILTVPANFKTRVSDRVLSRWAGAKHLLRTIATAFSSHLYAAVTAELDILQQREQAELQQRLWEARNRELLRRARDRENITDEALDALLASPLAKFEKDLTLHEDQAAHELYKVMTAALEEALASGVIRDADGDADGDSGG